MKINYTIPNIDIAVENVVLPTQAANSNVEFHIGPSHVMIEGDASELISYSSNILAIVKDAVRWGVDLSKELKETQSTSDKTE
jgi:hypothetical protein